MPEERKKLRPYEEETGMAGAPGLRRCVRDWRFLLPVIAVLIIGSVLRFHGIEHQSLSNDELSSWKRSGCDNIQTVINEGVRTDVHPPGYFILLHLVQKISGNSESALRFPSALFGVLSILVIFLIGLWIYSYAEGLTAAAFTAVLWCPIFYSQDARPYSMLLFFTLLSTFCWIRVHETLTGDERPRRGALIAYAISAVICAYSHYFGTYLIALQGIFTVVLFIRRRRSLPAVLIVYAAIAVAYLPWLPIMREHLARGPIWIMKPHGGFFQSLLEFLVFAFNDSSAVRNIAVVALLFLFAHAYHEYNMHPTRRYLKKIFTSKGFVLVLWLVVPFAGAYFRSITSTPVLTTRNLIISLPPAYLLLARSVFRLPVKRLIQVGLVCIAVILMAGHLIFSIDYYSRVTKDQYREVVRDLLENDRVDQCPVITTNANDEDYFNYYFERFGSDRRVDALFRTKDDWPQVEKAIAAKNATCLWYLWAVTAQHLQLITLRTYGLESVEHEKYFNAFLFKFRKKRGWITHPTRGNAAAPAPSRRAVQLDGDPTPRALTAGELWKMAMERTAPPERIDIYRALIEHFPDDDYAPQALYMIGFTYAEELTDTLNAIRTLEELIDRYPGSNLEQSARRMIADLEGTGPPIDVIIDNE